MKSLPFYLLLILPLTGFSQDSPAAIIVEDEEDSLASSQSTEEQIDAANDEDLALESSEPSEFDPATDEAELTEEAELQDEPVSDAPIIDEQAEEDLDQVVPEPAVTVKIELPKQIKLADAETSGFKLLTPWAPKPMQSPPIGWRYIPARRGKAYPVEVTLATGNTLSLSVTPYTLVPELSDDVVQAREPGYQTERGYQQVHSISARLQTATTNLEQAGRSLDKSIENLSELVDSLPK